MFTFNYNTTKSFDQPGPNQPVGAITTYYKADTDKLQLLKNYVYDYWKDMERNYDEDPVQSKNVYEKKLLNHRKKNKTYYTVKDVINDLNKQLEDKKDPTQSMIDRWNDGFAGVLGIPDASIETKQDTGGRLIPNNVFNQMFE